MVVFHLKKGNFLLKLIVFDWRMIVIDWKMVVRWGQDQGWEISQLFFFSNEPFPKFGNFGSFLAWSRSFLAGAGLKFWIKSDNHNHNPFFADSLKNDSDCDPHFILVFLRKIGFWFVIILPKNSNTLDTV